MAPLPIVAAGVSAGATLLGGQAAMAAGRYQQSVSERNAAMYRMKADEAYRIGENNIKVFDKNFATSEAQTEIAYMKAGVKIGEGTPMEVLKSQSTKVDDDIWNGLNATGGEIGDGFIVQFAADAAVIKANNGIVPLAAAITEANVESELKKVLAAIPAKLRRQDLKVVVSANVFQAYWFYLVSKGIAWNGTADTKEAKFGKYTLTEVNGLPDNTIAVYDVKNLVMATGLLADFNDIRVVDEDEIGLLTGQVRGKMVYNGGVGYYNSDEIVWYLSTTAVV